MIPKDPMILLSIVYIWKLRDFYSFFRRYVPGNEFGQKRIREEIVAIYDYNL